MKIAKKVFAFVLCVIMLAISMTNEGWYSLLQSINASAMAGHEQNYNDTRVELDFNKDWSFAFSEDSASYLKGFDDSDWEKVDLPHDFSMSQGFSTSETEGESGNMPGGTGWYRKWFNLYDYYTGDRVILNFDGAYQHTYVYVNGQYVGENHYGYNSFSFEISDYLICSNTALNLIAVKVVNELPSSRWYSGSGINRDVTLTIAGPVHVSLYGPRLTTPDIQTGGGKVEAKIKMHNDTAITKKVTVEATILDNKHNPVSETVVSPIITIPAETEYEETLSPSVDSPVLWTPDNPQLYKLKTVVKNEAGELIDEYHTTFGYRYISWDDEGGFKFNGEYMKLKGVCLHHDQGALGAIQEYDAIYRQLVILKEMGCNAIRTSHNSASRIVIDICNELGMLVVEEFFDGWDASKNNNTNDFSKYFLESLDSSNNAIGAHGQKWYQYVIEHTMLRDEHDPCVIAWDIGNELCGISSGESTANYQTIVQSIATIAKEIDPSRPFLQGNNEPNNSVNTMIDRYMDVIGGNYNLADWVKIMSGTSDSRTTKPFVATESASAINSRGVYNTMSQYDFQCTSYDTNAVSWGNKAAEAWHAVVTNDWFSGEFIWTGFDYIGEPTPWNNTDSANTNSIPNSSYFGVVDTAGFAKDSYYLYRSLWNEDSTTLHLVPGSWNRENLLLNNGYVNVAVYSNAKKIELLLNGKVIATANSNVVTTPAGYSYKTWTESIRDSANCAVGNFYTGNGADFYPQFRVKYAAGTLSVKAYDENNNEIRDTVGSTKSVTGTATQVAVNTWQNKDTFVANGADYIYVEFEARDADGNFMNDYNGTLNIKVDDSSARYAKIVGVDNGNPATTEKFQQKSVIISDSEAEIKMFNGKALAILKTTEEEGTINLTAIASDNSTSFSTQGVTVTSVSESGIELTDELDEVITQSGDKYEVTLYDEYEMVKFHIDNLEVPESGGNSGGSGGSGDVTVSDKFEIYLANSSASQYIPDGDYAIVSINNRNNYNYAMAQNAYGAYGMTLDSNFQDTVAAPEGFGYTYDSFNTANTNIFTFTHQGNNTYYIKNKSTGNYVYFSSTPQYLIYSSQPVAVSVHVNNDGSILIYSGSNFLYRYSSSFFYSNSTDIDTASGNYANKIWLYTAPGTPVSPPPTPPTGGDKYSIYTPTSNYYTPVEDGEYVILNDAIGSVLSETRYNYAGMHVDSVTDIENAPAGSSHLYERFNTAPDNVYVLTPQSNGAYYIQNKATGDYLFMDSLGLLYTFTGWQSLFYITANNDGSIYIRSDNGYYISNKSDANVSAYLSGSTTADDNAKIWLYSMQTGSAPSVPSTPPTNDKYNHYKASSDYYTPVADGDYVICNIQSSESLLVSGTSTKANNNAAGLANVNVSSTMASDYSSLTTSKENIYTFTSLGNGKYNIQHKSSGKYISINANNSVTLSTTPVALNVKAKTNGDVRIYNDSNIFLDLFKDQGKVFSAWDSSFSSTNANEDFRLYSAPKATVSSGAKLDLYNALLDGIATDPAVYTRTSYEALLALLEEGVALCKNPDATDAELTAATEAIYAAIEALELDIKQIDGTLFKYGYNNTNGQNYSSGGLLMNNIAIEQMKTAILADQNLVRQIKNIIGYDTTVWEAGYADAALEAVAQAYARIYTLQFTGSPINGDSTDNSASITQDLSTSAKVPVSPWNVWTKENTQGVNDSKDEGASIQGLASATLENGVVKSHAAYQHALSYANDGDSTPNDITNYTYTFRTGASATKRVTLEYLSGISVYFPDLFTRENLDANGNVTTDRTGNFSKYYWDAQFPLFISTDEFGVNTYHFDSSDTNYIVQSSFNDAQQTVDMDLHEVENWKANGSLSGSGFFPFNYQQGVSSYTGQNAIYHYGFTFEHDFYIPQGGKHANAEDVVFSFSGDDDVLVYVDGVLILDNGGLHGARAATINFTNCTVNYQYVIDVADGQLKSGEYETTYSYNNYIENPDSHGYNADTIAALNKLHDVISDGEVHTLNFYYLERGSTDSNCKISFNLSETSEEVRIIDQNLTLDYGLPVEYNITENNNLSQAAIDNGVTVEYLGICAVNEEVESTYTFEKPEIIVPFEYGVTYNVEGMKYGTCTIDKDGNTSYNLQSMNMSESEHFYVCAKISGDPTYAEDVVYYQIEKTSFIPASAIYYEDTFDTVTYTAGKVPSNYDNSTNQYGIWQTDGTQSTTLKQTADLTDSEANPYGYETNYSSFAQYSGGSVHYVDVSTKNNPNSKFSGGSGADWPTVDFTFTGTGFDLISITDCTTGAFSVVVKDADNKTVKSTVVDTFYGYNYGRIYSGADGKPTLDDSFTPMYRTETGTCTSAKKYYDENGAITDVIHYYDANGDVVETETDTPAYAYAYGWVVAKSGTTDTLYQIPVIKITDLDYGSYSVTITPTFTSVFGHSSTAEDGTEYYSIYLDAIKIYSPAGVGDDIRDEEVKDAYATDDELYPSYLEIKDMLIGADSLSENDTQGVIFIDGIAALDNDIATYRDAGPNNELYLAKDQAVAFEIWATSVPTDVQLGAKLACGNPDLTVSYASKTTDIDISTATDIYYSLNSILPNDAKLTWQQVTGSDGNNYYTTGTVVIQNTGDEGSVLSVTNLKWTFSQTGGKGYFRIPTPVENEALTLAATVDTQAVAYSLMRMRTAALDIEQVQEPEVVTDTQGNSTVTIKLNTSSDVDSLVVTDQNGNSIDPNNIEYIASQIEGEDVIEWTVTLTTDKSGTYTYTVAGAYANGYTDYSKAVTVTVTVEDPPSSEQPGDEYDDADKDTGSINKIFNALTGIYNKLIEFFRVIFALFGIII